LLEVFAAHMTKDARNTIRVTCFRRISAAC
jgi:hypothetical protein